MKILRTKFKVGEWEFTLARVFNVVLLWASIVTLYFWLSGHLLPYLIQARLVGGTVALWSFIELVPKVFQKNESQVRFLSRILSRQTTIVYLALIFVSSLILYFTTYSVYVRYAGNASDGSTFQVEIEDIETGGQILDRFTVIHNDGWVGRPFLFKADDLQIRIKIHSDNFYSPEDTVLHIGTSLRLDLPGDITKKPLNLIRIIPGGKLYGRLPFSRDKKTKARLLEIKVNSEKRYLDTLIRQEVFFGAVARELYWGISMLDVDQLRNYAAWYYENSKFPPRAGMLAAQTLEVNRKVIDSMLVMTGDEVEVTVYLQEENGDLTLVSDKKFKMASTNLRTVIMD